MKCRANELDTAAIRNVQPELKVKPLRHGGYEFHLNEKQAWQLVVEVEDQYLVAALAFSLKDYSTIQDDDIIYGLSL